jgi:hypothetical protein
VVLTFRHKDTLDSGARSVGVPDGPSARKGRRQRCAQAPLSSVSPTLGTAPDMGGVVGHSPIQHTPKLYWGKLRHETRNDPLFLGKGRANPGSDVRGRVGQIYAAANGTPHADGLSTCRPRTPRACDRQRGGGDILLVISAPPMAWLLSVATGGTVQRRSTGASTKWPRTVVASMDVTRASGVPNAEYSGGGESKSDTERPPRTVDMASPARPVEHLGHRCRHVVAQQAIYIL